MSKTGFIPKAVAVDAQLMPLENPRELQLSLARTAYNYMRSYPNLDAVPLCASVPPGEEFSADYKALVARSGLQIANNYLLNARRILEEEFAEDDKNPLRLPKLMEDIEAAVAGLTAVSDEALAEGFTAFLKSTLYDLLRRPNQEGWLPDTDFLKATKPEEYAKLIDSLPQPLMLTITAPKNVVPARLAAKGAVTSEAKGAVTTEAKGPTLLPCQEDWFFAYLQVAGFNTTNLRGVVLNQGAASKAIVLSDLQKKMKLDNALFQKLIDDKSKTLEQAVEAGLIFAVDYTGLAGDGNMADKESNLHGKHRYLPSPIAVFYWNEKVDTAPAGFPKGFRGDASKSDGVLQPLAIQLSPKLGSTIFAPTNVSGADDPHGYKWLIAKYFVNVACAIQHESVAHLGDCHFIIESIVVATHRQLSTQHPVFKLLAPHLRFTLQINNGALTSLVVPNGVVATNVGPNIHWTLELVNQARKAWRWDENSPDKIFTLRGVDVDKKLAFPFRDDTLLLWKPIKTFVESYVNRTFTNDSIAKDKELQGWFMELTSPQYAGFQGLKVPTTTQELANVLAQIIYTAGPLHASVNYAQYPLGAYMPSVAATIYKAAPTADTKVDAENYLDWFPPLDVALYTLSFEYLLSSVQYDVFGHYSDNPQFNYFTDPVLQSALEDFQGSLASAELEIQRRNRTRPMPYPFQLPSRIPNSISI